MIIKACHLTTVHPRYDVRILKKECVSLARHGYDVTLLVNDGQDTELVDGVKIISVDNCRTRRLSRILFSRKKMLKKALEINADIYHFHDPELLSVGKALIKNGKKVIYDSHEDTPNDIRGRYWIPKHCRRLISNLFALYESYIVRYFDAIITVTPSLVERFKQYNKNTYMVTNYPILQKTNDSISEKTSKQICFTGIIAPSWCHEYVLKALKGLDVKYVLAGHNINKYLEYLKTCDGKENLEYLGLVPFNEVVSIHHRSIAGIAILKPSRLGQLSEGTLGNQKLFEYMNSGIPVICSNLKLWKEIVEGFNCGICVDYDNPRQIREAILSLIDNPNKAIEMGRNGHLAVEKKYNWNTQAEHLLNIYSCISVDIVKERMSS